ncbi:MAG TPA: tetratricopeptide repeat protein [Polyangia bacterium]
MGSSDSRRTLAIASFLLLLLAGTAAHAADSVVVLPFRNVPGYGTLDYLIGGAPALIAEKLEQAQTLTPAFGPRLLAEGARVPADDADAARQAAAAGARYAITGSVRRLPNWDLDFEIRVLDRTDGTAREAFKAHGAGPKEEQLAVLDRLVTAALEAMQALPAGTIALERFHRPATRDVYAFFIYGKAVTAYHGLLPGQKKDLDKIEAGLRRAVNIDPKFLEAQRFLGLVLEDEGDARAARAEYASIVEKRPTAFWPLHALARLYRAEGSKARALEAATKALKLRPGDVECRYLRGELLWDKGALDEAHRELKQVTRDAPRHAGARRLLAAVCAGRSLHEEQARELEVLATLAPDDLQARLDLGAAYQRLERWDQAVPVYDEICRRNPKHFMAHKFLGDLYRRKRDWSRASVAYEQAMRLDPKDPRPYFLLSQTQAEAGNYDRAEKVLDEAQRFTQYTGEAYNNLGAVCLKRGDPARAQYFLRRALLRLGERPRVHYNMGLALAGTRQYGAALGEFRTAVKLEGTEPEYHYATGVTLIKLGRVEEAETAFRQAVVVGDDHPNARRNLALIAEMRRRRAEDEIVDRRAPQDREAPAAPEAATPAADLAPAAPAPAPIAAAPAEPESAPAPASARAAKARRPADAARRAKPAAAAARVERKAGTPVAAKAQKPAKAKKDKAAKARRRPKGGGLRPSDFHVPDRTIPEPQL